MIDHIIDTLITTFRCSLRKKQKSSTEPLELQDHLDQFEVLENFNLIGGIYIDMLIFNQKIRTLSISIYFQLQCNCKKISRISPYSLLEIVEDICTSSDFKYIGIFQTTQDCDNFSSFRFNDDQKLLFFSKEPYFLHSYFLHFETNQIKI